MRYIAGIIIALCAISWALAYESGQPPYIFGHDADEVNFSRGINQLLVVNNPAASLRLQSDGQDNHTFMEFFPLGPGSLRQAYFGYKNATWNKRLYLVNELDDPDAHIILEPYKGNVGIGTAFPRTKLHVRDDSLTVEGMTSGSPFSPAIVITQDNSATGGYWKLGKTGDGYARSDWLVLNYKDAYEAYRVKPNGDHEWAINASTSRFMVLGNGELQVQGRLRGNEFCIGGVCRSAWTWTQNPNGIHYASGNVGIGVDNPTDTLVVGGKIMATGPICTNVSGTEECVVGVPMPAACAAGQFQYYDPATSSWSCKDRVVNADVVAWSGISSKPAFAANAVSERVRIADIGCGSGWGSGCDSGLQSGTANNNYIDYADRAGYATSAGSANTANSATSAGSVPWSGVTGKPGIIMNNCAVRECAGGDWVQCSCDAGQIVHGAGCDATSSPFTFQRSYPVEVNSWVCGGHGSNKVIRMVCCATG